ncbi:hypothetical protein EDD11_005534 [Mortierella claussenii]|nr:hypothetical protein EDD11_005534 [Mortierella claussenii]
MSVLDTKHVTFNIEPVLAYYAYLTHVNVQPLRTSHCKNLDIIITPLVRHVTDANAVLSNIRIGSLQKQNSALMIPKGSVDKIPGLCAVGSTMAALAGVLVHDIMVQGNWFPRIFENHYRLSSRTSNNMTTATMGIPLESHMDMAP